MFAKQYADVMAQVSGQRVLISDRDQIIAVAGGVKKDKIGMAVSSQLEELMSNRDVKNGDEQQKLFEIIKGEEPEQCGQIIYSNHIVKVMLLEASLFWLKMKIIR